MEVGVTYYNSPVGVLEIIASGDRITSLLFQKDKPEQKEKISSLLSDCRTQLDAYFSGELREFDLPLEPAGTDFQRSVWEALLTIRYGSTESYMALAKRLGNVKKIRAVGTANGRNPVAIIIPCHRVIGSDGSLTGYGGGLWRKQWLLEHEKKYAHGMVSLF